MKFRNITDRLTDSTIELKESIFSNVVKKNNFKFVFSMKTSLFIIVIALLFSMVFCQNEDELDKDAKISFVKTELGGCNLKFKSSNQSTDNTVRNDSVNISNKNDSIRVFVGINYFCCAPFNTDCQINNDTIIMSINDTCLYPKTNCYCYCDCYYTFNFKFFEEGRNNYNYKIVLNSPLENKSKTIKEGVMKIR